MADILMVPVSPGSAAYQPWRCLRVSTRGSTRGNSPSRSSSGSSRMASEFEARSKVRAPVPQGRRLAGRPGLGEQGRGVVAHDVAEDPVALFPAVQRVEDVAGLGVEPAN